MAHLSSRALPAAFSAALSAAALPTAAAGTPPERVPGGVDPLLRAAPIEPERIRPRPTPGLAVPAVPGRQAFVLRYRPTPSEDPSKVPGPVVLHIPDEYARVRTNGPVEVWDLLFLLLHPSLKPATPAEDRCGRPWCGDEMIVYIALVPDAPPRTHVGSVQSEFEADLLATRGTMTYQAVPRPPGYEEAFTGTARVEPGRPYEEYLVYRGEHGERQIGRCTLAVARPDCQFELFDPGTHLQIRYNFSMGLLPQRGVIEAGLRDLVKSWQVDGRQ